MSLNFKLRSQRLLFFGFLNKLGILNENLISYDLEDENLEYVSSQQRIRFEDTNRQEWFDEEISIGDINPKKQVVDIENIKMARGHGWERKETYLDSYINITTESQFFEECWYISEKTFKPIANLQPFIIIGSPFTLKELKKFQAKPE